MNYTYLLFIVVATYFGILLQACSCKREVQVSSNWARIIKDESELIKLKSEARRGNSQAAWRVFLHYSEGLNEKVEAEEWLALATKLGNKNAEEYIAAKNQQQMMPARPESLMQDYLVYRHTWTLIRKSVPELMKLKSDARNGDSEAAWRVFLHYAYGLNENAESKEWLSLAVKFGNEKAKRYVATGGQKEERRSNPKSSKQVYHRNWGLIIWDETKRMKLKSDARGGNSEAAWRIYLHYALGLNVESEAEEWLMLAAKLGNKSVEGYIADREQWRVANGIR